MAPNDAAATIGDLTNGSGVELFIDASEGPPALQLAVETTALGGTIDEAA